jgi:PAS domain S-box-containing protein
MDGSVTMPKQTIPAANPDDPGPAPAPDAAFRQFFQGQTAVMLLVDPVSGRILEANAAAHAFYGHRGQSLAGMHLHEIEPETGPVPPGAPYPARHRLASRELRDVEVHCTPVRIGDRTLSVRTVQDLSRCRRAERSLEQSQQRIRAISDAILDAIVILDPEGRITFWNASATRIFGYTPDEALGARFHDLVMPEQYRSRHTRSFAEFQRTGRGFAIGSVLELDALARDGSLIPVELSISAMKAPKGWQAVGIIRDITLRKADEQALRQSERFLREAQAAGGVGCFSMDINLGIWTSSDTFDAIFGIGPDYPRDVGGWLNLVAPEVRDYHRQQLMDLIQNRGRFDLEFQILRGSDGEARWVSGQGSLEGDGQGQAHRLVGTFRDITESRRVQAENLRLQARLQQSQKMESLGCLAGGIAHDMNNILGAILGLASASIEAAPAGTPAHRAFDTISRAAVRGGNMVKQLLTFAHQNGVEVRILDLNSILREEVNLLERTTLSRVRLVLDLDSALRPIQGDATSLTNAFMNLCVNAVDAMTERGTLTLRTRNLDADWIEVLVKDTGAGMSRQVLDKAMEPFFTTKAPGKGTGLGLAMVHTTVLEHRGRMELQSEPGQGTGVRILFPAAATAASPAAPSDRPGPETSRRGLGVLLIDDDELIQRSVQAVLAVLGHRVTAAMSGEEALGMLEAGYQPEVVILDLNMPGLGGLGTLPRLRARLPQVPVLLATGRVDQTALDLIRTHPGVTLLPKPFSMRELQQQLDGLG